MIPFIFSFSAIYIYLGLRLSEDWSDWLIIALLFAAVVSFPFKKTFRWQLQISYAAMGILTYLTLFALLRDGIWIVTGNLYSPLYIIICTFLMILYGFLNASRGPRIKQIHIPINSHLDSLAGFRIVQISDLHIGPTIRRPYVENMVKKINKTNADVIVLTGDIGDGKVAQFRNDVRPLKDMKARYGSFYVPGNHEYYWNVNEWLTVMNNLGIINVVNRGKVIKHNAHKILIAGIPDPVSGISPDLNSLQSSEVNENADYKILLSHRPGIASEANKHGFDLQLSGHTHGGQFFPWTLVVKFFHKISIGLHKVGDMWIYINPGTGSWGPLLRVGTSPEITVIILGDGKNHCHLNR